MSSKREIKLLLLFLALFWTHVTYAGTTLNPDPNPSPDSNPDRSLISMTLEDLMTVEIVSASRSSESLFDSPVSSFVITSAEISEMGATSIPEALKVCPGVIVREVSNGSYDVSIRGGVDGLPAFNYSYSNYSILVMIDNRPVFSYYRGGTFWENLPVGLADVERIEVVYGPNAPLYGPNAVSGVVNIITKDIRDQEANVSGFVQAGTHTHLGSVYVGKQVDDKLAVDFSLNYDFRSRPDERFYDGTSRSYVPISEIDTLAGLEGAEKFANPDMSLSKLGSTAKIYYDVNEDISLKLVGGLNRAEAMSTFAIVSSLNMATNESHFVELAGQLYDGSIQVAYLNGTQGLLGNRESSQFDYENWDIYADYSFSTLSDMLTARPAVSYRSAFVSDKPYTSELNDGLFNNEGTISNLAGAVSLDVRPSDRFRMILSGRYDHFSTDHDGLFSYGLSLNYKLADAHTVRANTGRSSNGAFMIPTFLNSSNGPATIRGNPSLDLMTNTSYELGYRGNVTSWLGVDASVFHQSFEDFSNIILQEPIFTENGPLLDIVYSNLPLSAQQIGATLSMNVSLLESRLIFRPHVTVQNTQLKDYSPYYNVEGAYDFFTGMVSGNHIGSVEDTESDFTPSVWGGFNMVIGVTSNLTVDLSGYYFDDYVLHTTNNEYDLTTGQIDTHDVSNIQGKFTLSANVSYKFGEDFKIFATGRNITDQKSPEGMGSDFLSSFYTFGLKLNY